MVEETIPLIEYIRGKIYLGAYDYVPEDTDTRAFLTIDDTLPYNHFHHDFGPLTIAHLYRFAVILHEVLGKPENKNKELVFYSYTDPRSRANAATLLVSYMIIVQNWQPHQVMAPIAQMTPVMPFRDAGYSVADFIITVQDVAYGLWRAKNHGLLELRSFNLEEHEMHELVEYGDLNSVGEHFVAFASPVTGNPSVDYVFRYFKKYNVKLVVRLNSKLYDSRIFEQRGIKHVDLIFDDGTCPTMAFVQGFIGAAEGVIREGGKIAVHCRAGLGRTGCLIGAHLIYTYGFSAQEAIAYMRFLRPGMVVGPQQHWLYQHQNEFREWRRSMRVGTTPDPSLAGYSSLVDAALVPKAKVSSRKVLTGITTPVKTQGSPVRGANIAVDQESENETRDSNRDNAAGDVSSDVPHTPESNVIATRNPATVNSCLPQPTPGQPRKAPSPVQTRSAPPRASRYQSNDINGYQSTNSDDEDTDSLYDCSQNLSGAEDEEADVIINTKRSQTSSQPSLVTKNRSTSAAALRMQGRSSSARTFSSSSSRGISRPSSRTVSRTKRDIDAEAENPGSVIVSRQRRNLSEMTSPQQIALAKQLRVASNPPPRRKRTPEEGLEQIDQERATNQC